MFVRVLVTLWVMVCLFGCSDQESEPDHSGSVGLRIDQLLGEDDLAGFALAEVPRPFNLPADHGPHPEYRSEWWYITSVLQDAAGRDFGVQYTLFRQALEPADSDALTQNEVNPWSQPQAYLAHLAYSDVDNKAHQLAQRFSRSHPELAWVTSDSNGFKAVIDDWSLSQSEGAEDNTLDWRLQAKEQDEFALDLRFEQRGIMVPQGDRGLSWKGPGNASYYFSMPRLWTSGVLRIGEEDYQVSGWSWLDREWSTSVLGPHLQGWAWFAIQFEEGGSLMVFSLQRKDNQRDEYDHGMYLVGDDINSLHHRDYQLTPLEYWTAPSGSRWPVSWRLTFTGSALEGKLAYPELVISAAFNDQLNDGAVRYWEGLVNVFVDQRQVGRGYMELTGY
ncbi:MAG: lipocalin-like domain-containing protein [Pseudomonadota bacterium]